MVEYRVYFEVENDRDEKIELFEALKREREEGVSGYYDLAISAKEIVERVKKSISENPIYREATQVVVVGIGGSLLGTKALNSALFTIKGDFKEMIFLENPDPTDVMSKFNRIEAENSIFVIVSKSGGTIETVSLYKTLLKHFGFTKDDLTQRFIIITDYNSILYRYGREKRVPIYEIPQNVGGRFSVLSAVGVVPLTLAGFDTEMILRGAESFIESFFNGENWHLLDKALFLNSKRKKFTMNTLFAYASSLEDFTKWYVQLFGESLGKVNIGGERVGITPIAHIGSIDQHSFLQLLIDGPKDKSVTFIKVDSFEDDIKIPNISLENIQKCDFINGYSLGELLKSECEATAESLRDVGIPVDLIVMDRISAHNLGEIIVYFELLTSATGIALGVNSYNQPGVELGKRFLQKRFSG